VLAACPSVSAVDRDNFGAILASDGEDTALSVLPNLLYAPVRAIAHAHRPQPPAWTFTRTPPQFGSNQAGDVVTKRLRLFADDMLLSSAGAPARRAGPCCIRSGIGA